MFAKKKYPWHSIITGIEAKKDTIQIVRFVSRSRVYSIAPPDNLMIDGSRLAAASNRAEISSEVLG
jgi:hypothetical protein